MFSEGNVDAIVKPNADGGRELHCPIVDIPVGIQFRARIEEIRDNNPSLTLLANTLPFRSCQSMTHFDGEDIPSDQLVDVISEVFTKCESTAANHGTPFNTRVGDRLRLGDDAG